MIEDFFGKTQCNAKETIYQTQIFFIFVLSLHVKSNAGNSFHAGSHNLIEGIYCLTKSGGPVLF